MQDDNTEVLYYDNIELFGNFTASKSRRSLDKPQEVRQHSVTPRNEEARSAEHNGWAKGTMDCTDDSCDEKPPALPPKRKNMVKYDTDFTAVSNPLFATTSLPLQYDRTLPLKDLSTKMCGMSSSRAPAVEAKQIRVPEMPIKVTGNREIAPPISFHTTQEVVKRIHSLVDAPLAPILEEESHYSPGLVSLHRHSRHGADSVSSVSTKSDLVVQRKEKDNCSPDDAFHKQAKNKPSTILPISDADESGAEDNVTPYGMVDLVCLELNSVNAVEKSQETTKPDFIRRRSVENATTTEHEPKGKHSTAVSRLDLHDVGSACHGTSNVSETKNFLWQSSSPVLQEHLYEELTLTKHRERPLPPKPTISVFKSQNVTNDRFPEASRHILQENKERRLFLTPAVKNGQELSHYQEIETFGHGNHEHSVVNDAPLIQKGDFQDILDILTIPEMCNEMKTIDIKRFPNVNSYDKKIVQYYDHSLYYPYSDGKDEKVKASSSSLSPSGDAESLQTESGQVKDSMLMIPRDSSSNCIEGIHGASEVVTSNRRRRTSLPKNGEMYDKSSKSDGSLNSADSEPQNVKPKHVSGTPSSCDQQRFDSPSNANNNLGKELICSTQSLNRKKTRNRKKSPLRAKLSFRTRSKSQDRMYCDSGSESSFGRIDSDVESGISGSRLSRRVSRKLSERRGRSVERKAAEEKVKKTAADGEIASQQRNHNPVSFIRKLLRKSRSMEAEFNDDNIKTVTTFPPDLGTDEKTSVFTDDDYRSHQSSTRKQKELQRNKVMSSPPSRRARMLLHSKPTKTKHPSTKIKASSLSGGDQTATSDNRETSKSSRMATKSWSSSSSSESNPVAESTSSERSHHMRKATPLRNLPDESNARSHRSDVHRFGRLSSKKESELASQGHILRNTQAQHKQTYKTLVSLNAQTLKKVTEKWITEWRNRLPVGGFLITSWSDITLVSKKPQCVLGNSSIYMVQVSTNPQLKLACQIFDQKCVNARLLRQLENSSMLTAHPNLCNVCSHFFCRVPGALIDPRCGDEVVGALCIVLTNRPAMSLTEYIKKLRDNEEEKQRHKYYYIS